jgi:hypothetical protein
MSSVYGITLSKLFKLGSAKSCRGVDCNPSAITFTIKVVRGDNARLFVREASALHAMQQLITKQELDFKFYALGSFPAETEDAGTQHLTCFFRVVLLFHH